MKTTFEDARKRLILALDVPDLAAAKAALDKVAGQVGLVKVGLELFTACGPTAVEAVLQRGFGVFLDLKLHDIPNTVGGAVRAARSLGVDMLTVHTGGGRAMLARAVEEAKGELRILGVTLLTSLGPDDLPPVCITGTPREVVMHRARLAAEVGCGGVVCSPQEIEIVRAAVGPNVAIITPGIRPASAELGDQKRAATPQSAIAWGSDYLVVGRPILEAVDPSRAAAAIVGEIQQALESR